MHSSPAQNVLWLLSFLGTAAVLVTLVRRGHLHNWPSLFALCSVNLLSSALLFLVHHHYAWYFWIFWGSALFQSILRLWLLADVLRSIPCTGFIGMYSRTIGLTLALTIAVGAGWLAYNGEVSWVMRWHAALWARRAFASIILYDRCVAFAGLAFAICLLGAVFFVGLGWERTGAGIACGLGLQFAVTAWFTALFSEPIPRVRIFADYLGSTCDLVVLLLWLIALNHTPSESRVL